LTSAAPQVAASSPVCDCAPGADSGVEGVTLPGSDESLAWRRDDDGLVVTVGDPAPDKNATMIRIATQSSQLPRSAA